MKKNLKKKIQSHLKGDIKMYKQEADEDRELLDLLKNHFYKRGMKMKKNDDTMSKKDKKLIKLGKKENKIRDVMEEFKEGELRSGSKKGPKVKSRKQALAIALSEARKLKNKKRK